MRATSSGIVMAALLFGLVAILVHIGVTEAALVARSADTNNTRVEVHAPFIAEQFDLFDWNLCQKLSKKSSGNMVISPISLKLALVLLYEGAQGETKHELANALHFPDSDIVVRDRFANVLRSFQEVRQEYALDISTRLIVDSSIEPKQPYRSRVKQFYSTDVIVANLSDPIVALRDINDWVSNVTHGHVRKLLTDPDKLKDSVFLVLNALYFRGTWKQPFDQSSTRLGNFHTDLERTVQVRYMHKVGNYFYVDAPQLGARIIRLPYLGDKYSMFIVLPGARSGLSHLIENINLYILRSCIERMEEVPVDLAIPKFRFDFTAHLESVLRELGIREIFDNTASLIGIHIAKQAGQRLVVSDFVQKAGLEVNEFGTTAYAVTEVQIGNKIADTAFHVTHPFLFFIEDVSTRTVMFVGKVTNPNELSGKLEEEVLIAPIRFNPEAANNDVPAPAPAPVAPIETAQIDDRFNFFDIELLKTAISEGEDNLVISPASVKAALTTLIEGTGGSTTDQLLELLRFPSDVEGIRAAARRSVVLLKTQRAGVQLDLATRLWTGSNVQVNPKYADSLRQYYDSDIQSVNFGDTTRSAGEINGWVYQHTRGHIQSIIAPGSLGTDTKLLLTNALYLKGNWKKSFDRNLTVNKCFYVAKSVCQNAYFMHSVDYFKFAHIPPLAANVIELPYADGLLTMMIIVPERIEDGINRLARDLAHVSLTTIAGLLEETEIRLSMPRFTIETKSDLKPSLEQLGVRNLFDPVNANLTNMISGPVQIGSVLHNAKIQVNEEGTIAAAVTAAAVIPLMGSTVQRFSVDHPFVFIIRDSVTNSILFAGRTMSPDLAPNTNTQQTRFRGRN